MDAPEDEQDVKLQRKAPDFIADLSTSLQPFLWKNTKSGRTTVRRRVRVRDADRLVNLLEPFQEDPQLLDPHLDRFVSALADALLAYLRSPPSKLPEADTQLLQPLSRAICRLLYTFCKVRGEKVIVRFFSTETRHLELLLSAIERGTEQEDGQSATPEAANPQAANPQAAQAWEWEERYIVLLWLSQLLLAPFDLSSISSEDTDDFVQPTIPGLEWPANTPELTMRVISLAVHYLSSSGKERDAAKILLVRVAMRTDMQSLGILKALVQWALSSLVSSQAGRSTYSYIGILSFLAGILVSSESTTDMNPYLEKISRRIQIISLGEEPVFKAIKSSAVARKTILKLLRTIAVLLIHNPDSIPDSDAAIEATIDHLLDTLADPSTPVRLAASKALSVITLKLPEEMAVQVVSAVLENLQKNVLYIKKEGSKRSTRDLSRVNPLEWHGLMLTLSHLLYRHSVPPSELPSILNALRLGLVFEQRSTSGSSVGTNVRDAACFGIWALARRYSTADLQKLLLKEDVYAHGGPTMDSPALQVLATDLVVSASLDPAGNIRRGSSAALQELIGRHPNTIAEGIKVVQVVDYHAVALRSRAVLDVALHAAELADQYYQGLLNALLGWRGVQDGDHAARRVAADAIGKLVLTKQVAKIGISTGGSWKVVKDALDLVGGRLQVLAAREVEERHGLLLSLAAIIENFNHECTKERLTAEIEAGLEYPRSFQKAVPAGKVLDGVTSENNGIFGLGYVVSAALTHVCRALEETGAHWGSFRKPDLIAESCSRTLIAVFPILRADCVLRQYEAMATAPTHSSDRPTRSKPTLDSLTLLGLFLNPSFATTISSTDLSTAIKFTDAAHLAGFAPDPKILELTQPLLYKILDLNDIYAVDAASVAAADLMLLVGNHSDQRTKILQEFVRRAGSTVKGGRTNQGKSYIHALFKIFPLTDATQLENDSIRLNTTDLISTFWKRWTEFHEIEIRATILSCLSSSSALHTHTSEFVNMISEGLDDFTTNARGDVGSLVRIEATKAAGAIWAKPNPPPQDNIQEIPSITYQGSPALDEVKLEAFNKLFGKVLRAAAEKLDRVRSEGQKAVASALKEKPLDTESSAISSTQFKAFSTSSKQYFTFLLELQTNSCLAYGPGSRVDLPTWRMELMEGYITSADTGSEALVRASRAALAEFCESGHTSIVYDSLQRILEKHLSDDRLLIPCLEAISFLLDWTFLQATDSGVSDGLVRLVQSAARRRGKVGVRRLEACVKVLAGLCGPSPDARRQLALLARHRYPAVRNAVVDECWVLKGVGKGGNAVEDVVRALTENA